MSNISFLQSEIDQHDADGVYIATLDEDEATLEVIGNSTFITL